MQVTVLELIYLFIIQLLVIFVTMYIFWKESHVKSVFETDSIYFQIEKILLLNPQLYDFYETGPKEEKEAWKKMSEKEKKMYIFNEMNYFNFAFAYRELTSRRVYKTYWKIYDKWLKQLLIDSEVFRDVHDDNREYFETEFVHHVDEILADEADKKGKYFKALGYLQKSLLVKPNKTLLKKFNKINEKIKDKKSKTYKKNLLFIEEERNKMKFLSKLKNLLKLGGS